MHPSTTDIVVVILWSKLGLDLPPDKFPGPLTKAVVTGTEWEFEEAALAWDQTGKPDILVFRKVKTISVPVDNDAQEEAARIESARVKQFVRQWFTDENTGRFKKAYRTFAEPDQLEGMLHDHLRALIQAKVETATAGTRRIVWRSGTPFRGLRSRSKSRMAPSGAHVHKGSELREALVSKRRAAVHLSSCWARAAPGKSSLVKAGLITDVRIPGVVEGVGLCRYAIMRPGDASSGLCGELSRALFKPAALPELGDLEYSEERFVQRSRKRPAMSSHPSKGPQARGRTGRSRLTRVRLAHCSC